MKPVGHFVSSLAGAGFIYAILSNFALAASFFISSFFIDLDHAVDFVREFGLKKFSFRALCDYCDQGKITKIVLVLHSYELILILWIFITIYKLNILWVGLASGFTFHLIIDQFTNRNFTFSYFFTYRLSKRFKVEELFYSAKQGSKVN